MSRTDIKVGVIGLGSISKFHIQGYVKAGARIVHVSDINPRAAKEIIEKHHCRFSRDYRELLSNPEIEAISVCTANTTHKKIVLETIDAGKHILCEKTLTASREDSMEIVEKMRTVETIFQIGYMKRFFPAFCKAKELISEIGEPFSAYLRSYQGGFLNREELDTLPEYMPGSENLSHIKRAVGGGMLNMGGSHLIDLVLWLVGKPEKVYAANFTPPKYDAELKSNLLLELAGGGTVHVETVASPLTKIGYEGNGWDEKIEITGCDGRMEIYSVLWNKPAGGTPLLRMYTEKDGCWREFDSRTANAFDEEIKYFLDCVESKVQGKPDVFDGYAVDNVLNAAYESVERGCPVDIG